jgi:hypothetical protein
MTEWANTFEQYRRIGIKRMTLGSYRAGRLLSVAALEIQWRGTPERDVRMVVRLLAFNPMVRFACGGSDGGCTSAAAAAAAMREQPQVSQEWLH